MWGNWTKATALVVVEDEAIRKERKKCTERMEICAPGLISKGNKSPPITSSYTQWCQDLHLFIIFLWWFSYMSLATDRAVHLLSEKLHLNAPLHTHTHNSYEAVLILHPTWNLPARCGCCKKSILNLRVLSLRHTNMLPPHWQEHVSWSSTRCEIWQVKKKRV